MGKTYAVLTGDLIKSRRLSDRQLDEVRRRLVDAGQGFGRWKRGLVRGKPEFFRGDAWQMLLSDPKWALRAAVFLRASLRAQGLADTRLVIGMGTVDRIARRRISLSTGQAFRLSGHALDRLTQFFQMSIAVPPEAGALADWLPVVAQLCDRLIGHWTRRQAEIICTALSPDHPLHAEVAQRLDPPVRKQTVTRALAGADWHGLRSALKQFEITDWNTIG